jgi:hypothetical protein
MASVPPTGAQRQCPYCKQAFEASRFRPDQRVCSAGACQQNRRTDSHRQKRQQDPDYAEVCRDSNRKWREANPNYQKDYRQSHPDAVARNRQLQHSRDQCRGLSTLVKNNVALELTNSGASVYLIGPAARNLEKNNLAHCKLLILQGSAPTSPLLVKNT